MVSKHFSVNTLLAPCLLILAQTISSNGTPLSHSSQTEVLFHGPEVFLTVSPIVGHEDVGGIHQHGLADRKLVLNWHGLSIPKSGSFVGLFEKDPSTLQTESLMSSALHISMLRANLHSGREVTTTRYPRQNWTSASPRCTGYWAAHVSNNGSLVQSNCFKIYPTWLNDIRHVIQNIPLHSVMIPGTHNSGAFSIFNGTADILTSFVICQEDSIYEQLTHGVRYLDIRTGYYPDSEEKFWINHDQFRVQPFAGVLEDVKKFVRETNEIIFIDFHRFPTGFNDGVHAIFLKLIEKELGDLLAPKSLTMNATFADLWKLHKNIVLGYPDVARDSLQEFLWPNVIQVWGNTNKIEVLETFLNRSHLENGCSGKFWASMAHLTFNFQDILTRPDFGIREFANISNPKISEWYRTGNWYRRSNIVATDYYLSTNLMEMSFTVNKRKQVHVC